MKTYFSLITSLLLVIFSLSSCERDVEELVAKPLSSPEQLAVAQQGSFVCTGDNTDEVAFTFSWTKADFGEHISPVYSLLFDVKGGDFSNAGELVAGIQTLKKDILSSELNSIMHGLGLPISTPTDLDVKVMAKPMVLGTANPPTMPIAISESKVTINAASFVRAGLHFVGTMFGCHPWMAATHPEWVDDYAWDYSNYRYILFRNTHLDNEDVYTAQFRGDNQNDETGSPWIGAFKLFIDGVAGDFGGQNGVLGGGDIKEIKDPGYYTVKVNLAQNTYSIEPYNISGATEYTSVKLTGAGVSSDVTMTQMFFNPHIWMADDVELSANEVIFNIDGTSWGGETYPWGTATANGESISVSSPGTYFVKYNDLTGHYVFYKK